MHTGRTVKSANGSGTKSADPHYFSDRTDEEVSIIRDLTARLHDQTASCVPHPGAADGKPVPPEMIPMGDTRIDFLGPYLAAALDLTACSACWYATQTALLRGTPSSASWWDDAGNYVDGNTLSVYCAACGEGGGDPSHPLHLLTVRALATSGRGFAMTFYQDRQIRAYGLFLACISVVLSYGAAAEFDTNEFGKGYLSIPQRGHSGLPFYAGSPHRSLLPRSQVQKSARKNSSARHGGRGCHSRKRLLPFHAQSSFQLPPPAWPYCWSCPLCRNLGVLFGAENACYSQADQAVSGYLCGDSPKHFAPEAARRNLSDIFCPGEQLATISRPKTENEHQAKEFLKKSISDISTS